MPREDGLRGCSNGEHVWPPSGGRCVCGEVEWQPRQEGEDVVFIDVDAWNETEAEEQAPDVKVLVGVMAFIPKERHQCAIAALLGLYQDDATERRN